MMRTYMRVLGGGGLRGRGLVSTRAARAEGGPWVVRLRGLYIAPANNSDEISVPGALLVPKDGVHVSDKWAPEVDFEYFFARNWSTELILTYPQRHDVTVKSSTIYPGGPATRLPPVQLASSTQPPPT